MVPNSVHSRLWVQCLVYKHKSNFRFQSQISVFGFFLHRSLNVFSIYYSASIPCVEFCYGIFMHIYHFILLQFSILKEEVLNAKMHFHFCKADVLPLWNNANHSEIANVRKMRDQLISEKYYIK